MTLLVLDAPVVAALLDDREMFLCRTATTRGWQLLVSQHVLRHLRRPFTHLVMVAPDRVTVYRYEPVDSALAGPAAQATAWLADRTRRRHDVLGHVVALALCHDATIVTTPERLRALRVVWPDDLKILPLTFSG
ncbi:hypothetical protein R8Z50_11400 [Longispora sp. K20-0274]|uniref:hypothetical protein n=1 Tax=Longispora sp. K20-0274 TaxID=3088255 RepID=UPI00399A1B56